VQVTDKLKKEKESANPYGSIGTVTGVPIANNTQVMGGANTKIESKVVAQGAKNASVVAKQPSIAELLAKFNISYKTNQSVVRMPGCALRIAALGCKPV
jgi:hypothetical protein